MPKQDPIKQCRQASRDVLASEQPEKITNALLNIESLIQSETITRKERSSLKGMKRSLQQALEFSKKSKPEKVLNQALREILNARLLAERQDISFDELIPSVERRIETASALVDSLTSEDMGQLNNQISKFVSEKTAAQKAVDILRGKYARVSFRRSMNRQKYMA